ncbi:MAG: site-2 protease family protein [bacterium]
MLPSISEIIFLIPVILLSLSVHEFSHGMVSYKLGDPTPEQAGRLTLNPISHLDPIGTLVLITTTRFGWAKPVPVNPRYYKNPRRGMMFVGLAGPGSNILLAFLFVLIAKLLGFIGLNVNLIFPRTAVEIFFQLAIIINLGLAVFNLLPIPPLDGSKILRGVLPPKFDKILYKLEGPGGMILIMVLAFTGILGKIISPIIFGLFKFLISIV